MNNLLHNGFIAPFQNTAMRPLYIGAFLALLGIMIPQLYLAYDYAQSGLSEIMQHLIWRFVIGSILFMGFWLWLMTKLRLKLFLSIVLIAEILSLIGLFFVGVSGPITVVTILYVTLVTGFWSIYHGAMSVSVSDDNSGNEVSISGLTMAFGMIFGSILGGITLHYKLGDLALLSGGVFILAGTYLIGHYMYKTGLKTNSKLPLFSEQDGLKSYVTKYRIKKFALSVYEGVYQSLIDFLSPVWLMLLSLNGLAIGLITALSLALNVILSPLFGHLSNKGRDGHSDRDLQYGLGFQVIGWAPWVVFQTPGLYIFSKLFWSSGIHLFTVGLSARWYQDRTISNLIMREWALGIGRFLAIAAMLPLMYWSLNAFFIAALIVSTTALLFSVLLGHQKSAQS